MRPLYEAISEAAAALRPLAGEAAPFEARLLLAGALGLDHLRPPYSAPMTAEGEAALAALLARRLAGEPLQYILGEWEFMGLPFFVGPEALVPRQDTETLCEAVLQRRPQGNGLRLLDLGCGTGCIGLSLAKLGGFAPTLTDISPACLALTLRNAARLGVDVRIAHGDLFEALTPGETFDVICCNPPYIPRSEVDSLQLEVLQEPRLALDGGPDGLSFYRRLAAGYAPFLTKGGLLALEIGFDQGEAVRALFQGGKMIQDICGRDRVILLEG